jgi:hypothetical protein
MQVQLAVALDSDCGQWQSASIPYHPSPITYHLSPITYHYSLPIEHLDLRIGLHQVGEFADVACGPHDVVVDPMVVAPARLAEKDTMVSETMPAQG